MHFDFSWKGIWLEHLVLVVCSAILCIVTLIGCTTNDQRVAEGPIEPSSTPAVAESKDSWMKPTVPTEPLPTPTVTESENAWLAQEERSRATCYANTDINIGRSER